jgi:signal transduction histidine kinase
MHEAGLRLTLYARQPLTSTVQLHVHLLTQLVGYFYQAKQREQSLRDITRLHAVYETGSRLTHDLKNMLQSLLSLTAIAQSSGERAQQLLQQQLPQLSGRIEQTLLKLQQIQTDSATPLLSLNAWWDALQQRNQYRTIEWHAPEKLGDLNIPSALFDCVLDNLLDNAVRKRQHEAHIGITVTIQLEPSRQTAYSVAADKAKAGSEAPTGPVVRITVCDSGAPVEEAIAANLLRAVVVSPHGLGIGLYQAARWAEQLGYRLSLSSNQAGRVCFELRG